jgi:hypothetical protein
MLISEDLVGSLNEVARAALEDEYGALGGNWPGAASTSRRW